MDLNSVYFRFELQIHRTERHFKDALLVADRNDKSDRHYLLEGILSSAWQSYCSFVRQVTIYSSLGCRTASGVNHAPSIAPAKWERASYIALRASKGASIAPTTLNTLLIKEPTWGDSSKISDIINALCPGNSGTLKSHLAGGLTGPKHCQQVRNACAHKNHQTKADLKTLAPFYIASPVVHPTDVMTWRDPQSQEFAFLSWTDDMKAIAQGAVL
jgi:hypothetical protein